MGDWKKHPKKDLEALLREFADQGWRVLDGSSYYQVRCPCGAHKRSVHLSPSDPNYARNARQWLKRQQCPGKKEGEDS